MSLPFSKNSNSLLLLTSKNTLIFINFCLIFAPVNKRSVTFLLPSFYTSKQNDQRTSFRYSQVIKVLCIAPYAVETMHCK